MCRSVAQLADKVTALDPDFLEVARVWKGVVEVEPQVAVVAELVADEHVPARSTARYKGKGFDKRRQWERTWELQRMEDRGEPLPDGLERIPVPPRSTPRPTSPRRATGSSEASWTCRRSGSLRSGAPSATPTPPWYWHGRVSTTPRWPGHRHPARRPPADRRLGPHRSWPLVVALAELLPWLDQWHHEVVPRLGRQPRRHLPGPHRAASLDRWAQHHRRTSLVIALALQRIWEPHEL